MPLRPSRVRLVQAAIIAVAMLSLQPLAMAQQTVRIGQGVSTLSFLPLWSARALNSFAAEGLTANAVVIPGGDATALAALDAGDIDLAAVGSETVMRAFAKGQPFEMVYSLMSKVSLDLVAAPALLDRAGVKPGDPLAKRLAALKGAVVGVAAIGGAQEAAARWLAAKGGLDPKNDIKVAQVGNPVAIQAALENKRIDAFVLSPPEGYIAEKANTGKILVTLGQRFPCSRAPALSRARREGAHRRDQGRADRQDRPRHAGGQRGAAAEAGRDGACDPEAVLSEGRSGRHRHGREIPEQRHQ